MDQHDVLVGGEDCNWLQILFNAEWELVEAGLAVSWVLKARNTVWPSGVARAAVSLARLPPAPPRLSTIQF